MGTIMLIAVIFDVSERVDDFIKYGSPLKGIILEYYLNFILYYGNLFSALLIFIAVIWFTAKMASRTEIVAILSSGVSFTRMLRPYFIAATILAGGSLVLNHWLIPQANKVRINFENEWLKRPYRLRDKDIHKQIKPGEFIYFESFNNIKNMGYKFSIEQWNEEQLDWKLMADFVRFDTLTQKWSVENYFIRDFRSGEEILQQGKKLDTTLNFVPSDLAFRNSIIETMNWNEISEFIEEEKLKGSDRVVFYEIEKHQRTSYPMAAYVLTLIGVSISSRKVRGGIGLHLAVGLAIAVTYILAMKVTTVYATNAGLDPFIAVWIPNFLYLLFGLYIYRMAPK